MARAGVSLVGGVAVHGTAGGAREMLLLLQIDASSAALWRADQLSLDTGLQAGVWTKSAPGARCVGRGEAL